MSRVNDESPCPRRRALALTVAALMLLTLSPSVALAQAVGSAHRAQLEELGERAHPATDDDRELAALAARAGGITQQARLGGTTPQRDFVVFGYLQSETQVPHLRWHALTHVGSRFVGFDAAGQLTGTSAFTGRSSYLRAGGAAQVAGVRVILVLANFDDSSGGVIATVMTSPARRATPVGQPLPPRSPTENPPGPPGAEPRARLHA
jgi:hypothetical protein